MSIESVDCGRQEADDHSWLPLVPGGWRRRSVELGWTTIDLMLPATPDALLDTKEVQEANLRDDAMPYWATLWPAAEAMATILPQGPWPAGTEVWEIGCGLGLVGIAALQRGWQVHLTDYEPSALAAARYNAALNGFPDANVHRLDWRCPPDHKCPVILACDVVYEARHHQPVLDLIDAMLTEDGCCWIGDPGRTPIVPFYQLARERPWEIAIRDAEGNPCGFPVRGKFQVLQFRRRRSFTESPGSARVS